MLPNLSTFINIITGLIPAPKGRTSSLKPSEKLGEWHLAGSQTEDIPSCETNVPSAMKIAVIFSF